MANKHKKHISKRKRSILLFGGVGLVTLAFLFVGVFVWATHNTQKSTQSVSTVQAAQKMFRHPLLGFSTDENMKQPQAYGMMIDNHQDAWPQAGVDKAFLVYEAPVEGGITRLLAFFSADQSVDKIGPIRSARPYYLDWNNELDGLYGHVGGSNAALELIASGGTFDLNQYWNDAAFWRASNRFAPHNVYTSTDRLAKAIEARTQTGKYVEPLYETWAFKDPDATREAQTKKIALSFGSSEYDVKWNFDPSSDRYGRSHNGVHDVTEDGSQIFADNVAVIVTEVSVLDSVGRREVRTIGQGKAFVFQDGQEIEGTWKKPSESERTKFFDLHEKEIAFNPGITWIEVIPDLSLLTTY